MANKTTNYKLTKPFESEFYDVGVQNENMDKIDTQMKANADAVEALQKGQSGKADLVDGKVPAEQLPNMNYDPKGTAQNKVSEHNLDQTAHPYLLNQIGTCVEAHRTHRMPQMRPWMLCPVSSIPSMFFLRRMAP